MRFRPCAASTCVLSDLLALLWARSSCASFSPASTLSRRSRAGARGRLRRHRARPDRRARRDRGVLFRPRAPHLGVVRGRSLRDAPGALVLSLTRPASGAFVPGGGDRRRVRRPPRPVAVLLSGPRRARRGTHPGDAGRLAPDRERRRRRQGRNPYGLIVSLALDLPPVFLASTDPRRAYAEAGAYGLGTSVFYASFGVVVTARSASAACCSSSPISSSRLAATLPSAGRSSRDCSSAGGSAPRLSVLGVIASAGLEPADGGHDRVASSAWPRRALAVAVQIQRA